MKKKKKNYEKMSQKFNIRFFCFSFQVHQFLALKRPQKNFPILYRHVVTKSAAFGLHAFVPWRPVLVGIPAVLNIVKVKRWAILRRQQQQPQIIAVALKHVANVLYSRIMLGKNNNAYGMNDENCNCICIRSCH